MNEAKSKRGPVTRAEFDALFQVAQQAAEDATAARAQQVEVGALIRAMHTALMVPQPGHERSLLDRMASATIDFESGGRTAKLMMRGAGLVIALGGAATTLWAVVKFGIGQR